MANKQLNPGEYVLDDFAGMSIEQLMGKGFAPDDALRILSFWREVPERTDPNRLSSLRLDVVRGDDQRLHITFCRIAYSMGNTCRGSPVWIHSLRDICSDGSVTILPLIF